MIILPVGFDASVLVADLLAIATPFVALGFLVACGFFIMNLLSRA